MQDKRELAIDLDYLKDEVYGISYSFQIPSDIIRTIRDPEKPFTLEELDVVDEDLIEVECKKFKIHL